MGKLFFVIPLFVLLPDAALAQFSGPVLAIHDGDSLTVLVAGQRVAVNLDGIDAPELGQAFGEDARRSLTELCADKEATIVERTKDADGRISAKVTCSGVDANAAQVQRGMAWVSEGYQPLGSPLYELETNARLREIGLWKSADPVPPWKWRAKPASRGN